MGSYDPESYWSARLAEHFDLRGVGHISYSIAYNRWSYRCKRRALRAALGDITPPFAALDLGSGTGWVVRELLALGATVDGCDLTQLAVDRLIETTPSANFFRLAAGSESIPRADASYDVVSAIDVTYHITDDTKWAAALAEMARVLRPGGRLIITELEQEVHSAPHVRARSRQRWEDEAARYGLTLRVVAPVTSWLERPRDDTILRFLPAIARGAVEYALEHIAPREANKRCAVFVKA